MSSDKPSDRATQRPAALLRGAALLVVGAGGGLLVWLVDKAIARPDIQARQFGRFGDAVPLWLPLALFVALFVGGLGYLFWRAARRVEAGEDLFAQRHRRHPRERETHAAGDTDGDSSPRTH